MLNRSRRCLFIGSVAETRLNYTSIWRLLSVCAKRETKAKQQRAGVACRISCQLHRPRIYRLRSLVLSVNFTCWISMRLCLSRPSTQPARSTWLQSELQPSRIKHASGGSELPVSNQQSYRTFIYLFIFLFNKKIWSKWSELRTSSLSVNWGQM